MTANSLLAAAMAGGEDGLSPRDCWLCIAYLYAGGKSAQTQLNQAIADGLDRLPTGDVLKCIAYFLNGGSTPVLTCVIVSGAGSALANGTYNITGQTNGRNAYTQNGGLSQIFWEFTGWVILMPDTGSGAGAYSSSGDVATPDLATGWAISFNASNPPPTVTHC